MLSSNAILTDWDGQINVLERQDLPLLYRGTAGENQEDSLNNSQTNSKELRNISRDNSIEKRRNVHKTISLGNHNIVDDRDASIYGAFSESLTRRHECHDNISRASSSRFGSIYQQVAAGSSMLADSITEIMSDDYQNDHEPTSAILDYCKRKVALLITLSVQNFIEIIILSSYCIECYLLKVHLLTLSQKLLLHSIESADWMRVRSTIKIN
ncbi:uncharacterized protein LOC111679980 isoform X4 [Lucilia cuprina]|uniref:uncharacterized protein LOC111679980 isoform X4 n=1 Tax=Lucilia cuprina TaxID=7375 RepID=UPI001F06DD2C|nr:uncharacterized protein LOC111679980 isoform X4 [Lucilia cuprina]